MDIALNANGTQLGSFLKIGGGFGFEALGEERARDNLHDLQTGWQRLLPLPQYRIIFGIGLPPAGLPITTSTPLHAPHEDELAHTVLPLLEIHREAPLDRWPELFAELAPIMQADAPMLFVMPQGLIMTNANSL